MNNLLISRRSKADRMKFYRVHIYKKIRKYIREGGVGDLDLRNTPIEYLPKELKYVGSHVFLGGSQIKRLPDGLEIKEGLWMERCSIKEYPINVKIGGSVDIRNTNIKELPNNLTINENLYINNTDISKIPNNLNILNSLFCLYTPVQKKYTPEEIKQMILDRGGSVREVKYRRLY